MKKINIVLFGIGKVGSTLINQVLDLKEQLDKKGDLEINFPVILNSTTAFFEKKGVKSSWRADFKSFGVPYDLDDVIEYVKNNNYENLIAIDATPSEELVNNYSRLINNGFHLVAANKVANTLSTQFYEDLRLELIINNKHFLYETNVGAGLPVVECVKDLYSAGEKVTKIRGVFSGSLSYIFNTFSENDVSFSEVVKEAVDKGFTEPDPRIDLSGKDVARKLLILGRELQLKKELQNIKVRDLVPVHIGGETSPSEFIENLTDFDAEFSALKNELKPDEVIRHVGELDVATGNLEVKLVKEIRSSPFGSLQHADASFEIYTESYGDRPIVIQGAGAGAAVTARGVLSDILKLSAKL